MPGSRPLALQCTGGSSGVWASWQSWRLNVPRATDCPHRAHCSLSILDMGAGTHGVHRCMCVPVQGALTARANGGSLCPQSPGPQGEDLQVRGGTWLGSKQVQPPRRGPCDRGSGVERPHLAPPALSQGRLPRRAQALVRGPRPSRGLDVSRSWSAA